MSRALVLLPPLAALILLAAPRSAEGCSCVMPPPPKAALKEATAVFAGKIIKVDQDTEKHRLTARFEVSRWWKGGGSAQTNVATIDIGSMCGLDFKAGDTWLIYASGPDDGLSASLCSRSRKQGDAADDRKALGAGSPADPNKPSPPAEPVAEPAPAEPAPAEPAPVEPAPPAKVERPPAPAPAPTAPASPAEPQPTTTQGCSLAGSSGGGLACVLLVAPWVRRRARRRDA